MNRFGGRRPMVRKQWSDFEECMSYYWKLINYNTGTVDDQEEDEEEGQLTVDGVDVEAMTNAKDHRTNEFDITDSLMYDDRELLVVRRGQNFNLTINFNRPFNVKVDDLRLVLDFGKRPLPSKGTHVDIVLSDEDIPNKWGAFIKPNKNKGNALSIVVVTPPTCPVGKWSLKIDVIKRADREARVYRYKHRDPVYILFNPWCKGDQVYMEEQKNLEEYVLNESGIIYRGSQRRVSPCPWEFGQFSGDILDCVLYLLDKKSKMPDHARGDPVKVARMISSLVNGCDNGGVLDGNWSGDYTGGTSPLKWTGSVCILEEYYRTKKTVKFGQCWVFSGVVTTACRALGIPARSVTNFASAHDTDNSVTIDVHFDANGDEIEYMNDDSVWNFHVWNDVWMARPDIGGNDYGGWQAIDSTPQEASGGVYCMGPMSLEAIKRGEINMPYDGHFVFAEVNADKIYWSPDKEGTMKVSKIQKHSVGKFISTKIPFGRALWRDYRHHSCPQRQDITDQYKYEEGTTEERAAVRRANLHSKRRDIYQEDDGDVSFELTCNHETFIGEEIQVGVQIKNTSDHQRTVSGTLKLSSVFYTGVVHKEVLRHEVGAETVLEPNEEKCIALTIPPEEYIGTLTDSFYLKLSCMLVVAQTNQIFVDIDDLRLRKPHLNIKAPETGCTGLKLEVEVSFENPLPVTLTKCELRFEGPGLQRSSIKKLQNVNAKHTFTHRFDMCPVKAGQKEIIAAFNSDQLAGVNVSVPIKISKNA